MTTLAQKLAIKDGRTFAVLTVDEHKDFPDVTAELELDAPTTLKQADVVLLPAATEPEIRRAMEENIERLNSASVVWICYQKGNAVEINREKLWIILADYSWKAVSQVSLNDTWSALRVRPMTADEMSK